MSARERAQPRTRSNRPASKSPINCTQYFIERVNKVLSTQLYETAMRSKTKDALSHRSQHGAMSPFLGGKHEESLSCRTARSRMDKTCESALGNARVKGRKVAVELGLEKVGRLVRSRMNLGVAQVRRNYVFKEKPGSHHCTDAQSTHFESQLSYHTKQSSLADMLALTQCPNCKHVGVSLLTTSTKEQLSPKFMTKIRNLLPSNTETTSARRETRTPSLLFAQDMKDSAMQSSNLTLNKEEPPKEPKETHELSIVMYEDAQIPDISEIHMNTSSQSISIDSSPLESPRESLTIRGNVEKSPDFNGLAEGKKNEISFELVRGWKKGESNLTDVPKGDLSSSKPLVPRLNFSELTPSKLPIRIFDRKKLSSGKVTHFLREKRTSSVDSYVSQGLERVISVYKVRLQRAFDMVFLSRAAAREVVEEPSMTFEFSLEDGEENYLAGTFGSRNGLKELKLSSTAVNLMKGKLEKVARRCKKQAWSRLCR